MDEVEDIRSKTFYVTGKNTAVEEYVKDKKVVFSEEIGSLKKAAFIHKNALMDKGRIESMGMELTPVPLQKLFIYITESRGGDLGE